MKPSPAGAGAGLVLPQLRSSARVGPVRERPRSPAVAAGLPPVPVRPSRDSACGPEIAAAAPGQMAFCPAPLCTGVTAVFLEELGELCR